MKPEVSINRKVILENSRTLRGFLTFISTILHQFVQIIVGLVVTPIVVRGLGAELYGAWRVIQQMSSYLALGDLKPTSALKLTLAISQHDNDYAAKRRQVGSAILIWFRMLPVLLTAGLILVAILPLIVHSPPSHTGEIRLGMALVILNVSLTGLLAVPHNVLRGMNLDYKSMCLTATTFGITGLLSAVAILIGLGLPGLAASVLLGAIINSGIRLYVVRRFVPWFGVERPLPSEIKKLFRLSWWVFGSSIAYLMVYSTDLILIGVMLDTQSAGIYATTGLVLQMASGPIIKLISSGGPGIADLWGRKEFHRVATLRITMQIFSLLSMTVLGVGVLLMNQIFLKLWIGPGWYAGNWVNMLMVLVWLQSVFSRVDILLTDCMLELRTKTIMLLTAGTIGITLALFMTPKMGLAGLTLSILIGRAIFTILITSYVSRRLSMPALRYIQRLWRPVCLSACLLGLAFVAPPEVGIANTWVVFFSKTVTLLILAVVLLWSLALTRQDRQEAINLAILPFRKLFLK